MRTHIDLFSGIGGFALAARWAGIKTVQFVELDPFCQKVLKKNFQGVPIHDDIKTFTNAGRVRQTVSQEQATGIEQHYNVVAITEGRESREQTEPEGREDISGGNSEVFLLTGGFPCQPFSCAGKRKGTSDDRHLWPEMLRVIKEFKPTWIIGENVAGIRSMELVNSDSAVESNPDIQEDGENDYTTVLDGICNDLEGIGYEVQPIIIPACAVNAPHRRDRVWFIACNVKNSVSSGNRGRSNGNQGECERPLQVEGSDSHAADSEGKRAERQFTGREQVGEASCRGRYNNGYWQTPWLEVATRLCRVDDGVSQELYKLETSDRVARLKALGNAIVPQVAFEIMKAIAAMELEGK